MTNAKAVNPLDQIAIQNTISRYCEALDTKLFSLFEKVFVPDVVADYPFNSNMRGVDAVRTVIQNRLGPITTHHSLTTQTIIFNPTDPKTANALTYFVGSHFGQGKHEGKLLQAYGKYIDELVCVEEKEGDFEGVAGASGVWRIRKRTVAFTKRIGDEAIMEEF